MRVTFLCTLSSFLFLFYNPIEAHPDSSGKMLDTHHHHDDDDMDDDMDDDDEQELSSKKNKEVTSTSGYKEIHTEELRKLLKANKDITIIDARPSDPKENKIPGSKSLPYNAKEEIIKGVLTDKNAVIVVYCYSVDCPLSHELAKRLVKLGYTNVLKYPEGIEGWKKSENASDSIKTTSEPTVKK